jgi:hypothetical protein
VLRRLVLAALLAALPAWASAAPWLVVSDVHYDPFSRRLAPSPRGHDTNDALLHSLLVEMQTVDPNPPVIVMPGDFLAHGFRSSAATATLSALAVRFGRAFPNTQFLIALGNNDSACGDYQAPLDGAFLHAVAHAWAPLVDRNGAAPDFITTFSHDGSYVATLPVPHLRAVVINDVSLSLRYRDGCAGGVNAAARLFERLQATLRSGAAQDRYWLVLHVPPGIDAYSTSYLARDFVAVPFLRPRARDDLLAAIDDPRDRVALVIAGHTHRFSFRVSGSGPNAVPMLLAPSVSPVFGNAPAFLVLDVTPEGAVANVAETSFLGGRWQRLGDLASLGVNSFDAAELEALEARLDRDPAARARFIDMYGGGAPPEINARNWNAYWCAAVNFTSAEYRNCATKVRHRFDFEIVLGAGLVIALAALAATWAYRRRARPA